MVQLEGGEKWRGLTYDTISGVGFDFEISSREWQSRWMLDVAWWLFDVVQLVEPSAIQYLSVWKCKKTKNVRVESWTQRFFYSLAFPLVVFRLFAIDSHYLPTERSCWNLYILAVNNPIRIENMPELATKLINLFHFILELDAFIILMHWKLVSFRHQKPHSFHLEFSYSRKSILIFS